MKNEQKILKNEFGSLCSQFGFSQIETKSSFKKKQTGSLAKISFTIVKKELMVIIGWMKWSSQDTSKEE